MYSFDEVVENVHSHAVVYELLESCRTATSKADIFAIEAVLDRKPFSSVGKGASAVEYERHEAVRGALDVGQGTKHCKCFTECVVPLL